MDTLPISIDIVQKRSEIPKKIAELSYLDESKAIHFIRIWGEKRMPITELHNELIEVSDMNE